MLYGTAGTMKKNSVTSTAAIPSAPVVLRRSFNPRLTGEFSATSVVIYEFTCYSFRLSRLFV